MVIAPSMFTIMRMTSRYAISAWNRRFEKVHKKMPPTTVVAVKLTAMPVVRTARRIASSMSEVSATSCRMRSTM